MPDSGQRRPCPRSSVAPIRATSWFSTLAVSMPMPALFEAESTLTDRYQTTVPERVREALNLKKRDKIHYHIRSGNEVVLTRAPAPADDDPALAPFLSLLEQDISQHPEHLQPVTPQLVQRLRSLTDGVEVDLTAALPDDEE